MDQELPLAAQRLVASLREAIEVFEEQGKQAEIARETAERTRQVFSQWANRRSEQTDAALSTDAQQPLRSLLSSQPSLEMVQDDARASGLLSLRWETAFCDVYEALMQLCAYPEARPVTESITGKIRALRLLQVEQFSEESPAFTPPTLNPDPDGPSRRERALSFMLEMDRHLETVVDGFDEKIQLTASYLRDALSEAETLAASVTT
jgi:hypothetical protein